MIAEKKKGMMKNGLPEIPEIFNTFSKLSVMRKMKCQSAGSLALGFLGFKILFKIHQKVPQIPQSQEVSSFSFKRQPFKNSIFK